MYLRKLELKDAPLMLEWMHDPDVVKNLRADFSSKKIEDAIDFIKRSDLGNKSTHAANQRTDNTRQLAEDNHDRTDSRSDQTYLDDHFLLRR